jgi:hypothetical protein
MKEPKDLNLRLRLLVHMILSGQSVYIETNDGAHERDLIHAAMQELDRLGCLTASVSVKRSYSIDAIAKLMFEAVHQHIRSEAAPSLSKFSFDDPISVIISALDLAEALGTQYEKRFVLHIDEFQIMADLDDQGLLKKMRSVMQMQRRCVYVFSGSDPRALNSIFASRYQPLYRFALRYV